MGWRPLLASSALAAALVFWIRRQVPESSRYLAASGHAAQARQVLAQVAEANRQPLPAGELQAATRGPAVGMASLWSRPYRAITTVLWVAWFAILLGYYGMFS